MRAIAGVGGCVRAFGGVGGCVRAFARRERAVRVSAGLREEVAGVL